MKSTRRLFKRLLRDESGGEVIEYAMILGLISIAAIALIGAVSGKVAVRWLAADGGL